MHESARKWNAIYVIYLLEISGANKLSLFDVLFRDPLYISQQKTRVILFSTIASIKLAFWACFVQTFNPRIENFDQPTLIS